jgi:hypothetical protein
MPRVPPEVMQKRKAFIMANYQQFTSKEIAEALDIYQSQVSLCCTELGVTCIGDREKTIQFIKDHPTWRPEKIAEALGKNPVTISNIIRDEKLRPKKQTVAPQPMLTVQDTEQKSKEDKKRQAEIRASRASFTKYNQSHSPFGYADQLRGIETTGEVQKFYPEIVRL